MRVCENAFYFYAFSHSRTTHSLEICDHLFRTCLKHVKEDKSMKFPLDKRVFLRYILKCKV